MNDPFDSPQVAGAIGLFVTVLISTVAQTIVLLRNAQLKQNRCPCCHGPLPPSAASGNGQGAAQPTNGRTDENRREGDGDFIDDRDSNSATDNNNREKAG